MLVSNTARSIQVKLAGAITTVQLPVHASYKDINHSTGKATRGSNSTTTNSTTAVDIIPEPGEAVTRIVEEISIYNADSGGTDTAQVYIQVGGGDVASHRILNVVLATLESLHYTPARGWHAFTAAGLLKETI